MQTFLPHPNYFDSAHVLDNKRLNKQRIECEQIYNVLIGRSNAWANHPAVIQWHGYAGQLTCYWYAIEAECRRRGFKARDVADPGDIELVPWWLGIPRYHTSHALNLLWKNSEHYSRWFPGYKLPQTKPDYVWPSKDLDPNTCYTKLDTQHRLFA